MAADVGEDLSLGQRRRRAGVGELWAGVDGVRAALAEPRAVALE